MVNGLESRVRRVIAEHFCVNISEISDNASFTDNLGADSLDVVEVGIMLDKEFGCQIPDEGIDGLKCVGDAIRCVRAAVESVAEPVAVAPPFQNALARIARGRTDCGRPLAGEDARQIARTALTEAGAGW